MQLTRREVLEAALPCGRHRGWFLGQGRPSPSRRSTRRIRRARSLRRAVHARHEESGMTLVLADREGVQRVTTYGFGDLDRQRKLRPKSCSRSARSRSRSWRSRCCNARRRQARSSQARRRVPAVVPHPIGVRADHDTPSADAHVGSTRCTGSLPVRPAERHLAAYAPGEQFHYNNMAYTLLGFSPGRWTAASCPRSFASASSSPLACHAARPRSISDARSHAEKLLPSLSDRPYPRHGELCEAPQIVDERCGLHRRDCSRHGCVPADAREPRPRTEASLVSPESFELFSKRHIKAEEFGPTASYGYGIAVDELDGNPLLRHTGGMVSYMSALQVDIARASAASHPSTRSRDIARMLS